MLALNQATIKHQINPLKLNTNPKNKNDKLTLLESAAINCGTKAIKNNATLGFKALVKKPW